MSRPDFLRSQLERATQRLAYARRELRRFEDATNDVDDARRQRQWSKLVDDVRKAEVDVGYAQNALRSAAFADAFRTVDA